VVPEPEHVLVDGHVVGEPPAVEVVRQIQPVLAVHLDVGKEVVAEDGEVVGMDVGGRLLEFVPQIECPLGVVGGA